MSVKRQGEILLVDLEEDVFLRNIKTSWGAEATLKEDGIIAEGEKTGHKHQLVRGAKLFVDRDGNMFVKVEKKTLLKHPEHKSLVLKKGYSEVIIQREYEEGKHSRKVMD